MQRLPKLDISTSSGASDAVSSNEYHAKSNRITSPVATELKLSHVVNASLRRQHDRRSALWAVMISSLGVLALAASCYRTFTKSVDSRYMGRRLSGRDSERETDYTPSQLLEFCYDASAQSQDSAESANTLKDEEGEAVFRTVRSFVELEKQIESKESNFFSLALGIPASYTSSVAPSSEGSMKETSRAGFPAPQQTARGLQLHMDVGSPTHPAASITSTDHGIASQTGSFVSCTWAAVGRSDEALDLHAFTAPGCPEKRLAPSFSTSLHHAGSPPHLTAQAHQPALPTHEGFTYQYEPPLNTQVEELFDPGEVQWPLSNAVIEAPADLQLQFNRESLTAHSTSTSLRGYEVGGPMESFVSPTSAAMRLSHEVLNVQRVLPDHWIVPSLSTSHHLQGDSLHSTVPVQIPAIPAQAGFTSHYERPTSTSNEEVLRAGCVQQSQRSAFLQAPATLQLQWNREPFAPPSGSASSGSHRIVDPRDSCLLSIAAASASASPHYAGFSPHLTAPAEQPLLPLETGFTFQHELPGSSLLGQRREIGHNHRKSEEDPRLGKRQRAQEELEGKQPKKHHSGMKNRSGTHAGLSALPLSADHAPASVVQTPGDNSPLSAVLSLQVRSSSPLRSSSVTLATSGSAGSVGVASFHVTPTSRDQNNSAVLVAEEPSAAAFRWPDASHPLSEVEISLPEPAPKQSSNTHPYYRLPVVEGEVQSTFVPERVSRQHATKRVPHNHLVDMRVLLDEQTIDAYGVERLIQYAEEVVSELFRHHWSSVQHKEPSYAVYILGRRYLLVEALFCTIQVLGRGPMRAEEWWCKLMQAIEIRYTRDDPHLHMKYGSLAVRLSEALRSLRAGKRPSERDTVQLRTDLFLSEDSPPRFKKDIWEVWRRVNQE